MLTKSFFLGVILLIVASSVNAKTHNKQHLKEHKYTVVKVADGDTITVKNHTSHKSVRIRFLCIDAPEKSQPKWGNISLIKLKELLPLHSQVKLAGSTTDLYNRTLAEVINSKGVNTNLKMMEIGMVVFYPYQKGCKNYKQMEKKAKKSKKGVWSDKNFVKPWDYRKTAGIGYRGGAFDKKNNSTNKVTKPHHKYSKVTPKSTTEFSWNKKGNKQVTPSNSLTTKMSWAKIAASGANSTSRRSERLANKSSTISYKDILKNDNKADKSTSSSTTSTTTTKKTFFNKLFNW